MQESKNQVWLKHNMDDIILIALEKEAPNLAKKPGVFLTGVGKVAAAITAAKLIEKYKPKRVFNFGTAGGINVAHGNIYKCSKFTQRDFFVSGCLISQDSFNLYDTIMFFNNRDGLHLSTGDNFVTDPAGANGADLVDMEAYAIARACEEADHPDIEFLCYKYVSDTADENAADHFKDNIHKGEEHYFDVLKQHGITFDHEQ